MPDSKKLSRPRLKQGETPQSPAYQDRLRKFLRQEALAEATAAQEAQRKAKAKADAKRDVLKEAEDKPGSTPPKKDDTATKKTDDTPAKDDSGSLVSAVRDQLQSTRAGGLKSRIDNALDAIEGGIKEADDDNKRKR